MTFLNPLDALIPKIPFSSFPDFWVWVTSEARGAVSVGFWGSCQLSLFLGGAGGGVRPEGSITPPPQKRKPGLPGLGRNLWKVCPPWHIKRVSVSWGPVCHNELGVTPSPTGPVLHSHNICRGGHPPDRLRLGTD